MAPEVLGERPQSGAVDVWSAGITLLELLTGHTFLTTPHTGLSATDQVTADRHRTHRLLKEILERTPLPQAARPQYLSLTSWSFVRIMLVPKVMWRATVKDLLRHAWFHRRAPEAAQRRKSALSNLMPGAGQKLQPARFAQVPTILVAGEVQRSDVSDDSTAVPSESESNAPNSPPTTPLVTGRDEVPGAVTFPWAVAPQQPRVQTLAPLAPRPGGRPRMGTVLVAPGIAGPPAPGWLVQPVLAGRCRRGSV